MEPRPSLTVLKSKQISSKKVLRKLRTFLDTQDNDRINLATIEIGDTADFNACLSTTTLANLQTMINSLNKSKKSRETQPNPTVIDDNNNDQSETITATTNQTKTKTHITFDDVEQDVDEAAEEGIIKPKKKKKKIT